MGRVMGIVLNFALGSVSYKPRYRFSLFLPSLIRVRSTPSRLHPTQNSPDPKYKASPRSGFSIPNLCKIKSPATDVTGLFMGRMMGFEPTHKGTTILGLNRLTTSAISYLKYKTNKPFFQAIFLISYI